MLQMHNLSVVQPMRRTCGRSCQTFQFVRIFAQFSRVDTNFSEIEINKKVTN